ncbi:MAG: DUF1801 domain-containing protein [Thermoplasmata archaeon]
MPAPSPYGNASVKSSRVSMTQVAERANELIRRQAPQLKVEKRWGKPWYVGTDMVCRVGAFTHHVGVEFWRGSTLPDPDHLLEGTGKNLRHVKLRTLEEASSPKLARLVQRAVALDRTEPKRTR